MKGIDMANRDLAPTPQYPERVSPVYERKTAEDRVGNRGPLRFEEGLATDTDLPTNFQTGVMQGYITAPGRVNHNANVYEKSAEETMRERAHVGSAAWVEAPTFLGEYSHGSNNDIAAVRYEQVDRSGGRYERSNPARIDQ
jgi:hypothetical protein